VDFKCIEYVGAGISKSLAFMNYSSFQECGWDLIAPSFIANGS
jgi:hypothetical protein